MRILGLTLVLAAIPSAAGATIHLPMGEQIASPSLTALLPPIEEVVSVGSLKPLDTGAIFLPGAPNGPDARSLIPLVKRNPGRVPEPGTWAFALAAFGFAGYVLRRARHPGLLQMA